MSEHSGNQSRDRGSSQDRSQDREPGTPAGAVPAQPDPTSPDPISPEKVAEENWLEHSMQVEIAAPVETVWEAWSNLENMPQWMYWIHSVSILEDDPELSRWTLKSGPWEFSWLARTLKVVPNQIIQWKSVDGLPNRGAIRFYDRKDSSVVKMTIAYGIPGPIGKLMDNLFLGRIVESTIQGDLERFRTFVLAQQSSS